MFLMFRILLQVTVIHCTCAKTIQSPKSSIVRASPDVGNENVTETQYTNCRISSAQLIADAQATVTRVSTGGCNAKSIDERFTKLELIFMNQIAELKELIRASPVYEHQTNTVPQESYNIMHITSPRQCEIEKYNCTLHELFEFNGSQNLFTYYWRIEDVKNKLFDWGTGHFERSNKFYVNDVDYAMFMKFTPNYFPDGTIFISVGLTKGQYDRQLTWPFSLRLRIEILDHSPEHSRLDRRSMIWNPSTMCPPHFWGRPGINGNSNDNPECVGLSIPRHILLSSNRYLWQDNLFIKLTIFL